MVLRKGGYLFVIMESSSDTRFKWSFQSFSALNGGSVLTGAIM